MDTTSERSYLQVNRELDKMVPRGKAYFSAGATILRPDLQVFKNVLAIQAEFRAQIPQARHMVGFDFTPLPRSRKLRMTRWPSRVEDLRVMSLST